MILRCFILFSFFALRAEGRAQTFRQAQPHAGLIMSAMDRLPVFGNVLYLAAHPDDENTRFIAWCANEMHLNTAYLSITRGDGGQNLVGPELREELGLIRTQELLAARRTDGGVQYFTRANDFGYSKTTDETLRIWDKEQVLEDMVRVIRMVRPDVIVCRFPPDSRAGHGHHSASAVLGKEAFAMAADPNVFPEQVEEFGTWRPVRIVINTGRWWNEDISENDPGVVMADIGQYNPLIGLSYNELAAQSRSLHKSQGFGSTGTRGELKEYFEHYDGSPAGSDLFDGIDLSAKRSGAGKKYHQLASDIRKQFRPESPWESIPGLAALHRDVSGQMADPFWREIKLREIEDLITSCAGLYIEGRAEKYEVTAGERIKVSFECINRSAAPVLLRSVSADGAPLTFSPGLQLRFNRPFELDTMLTFPVDLPASHPPHLANPGTPGMFRCDDSALAVSPEGPPAVMFTAEIEVEGIRMKRHFPITYRWNDPVDGERHRPVVIVPPVTLGFDADARLCVPGRDRDISLTINAHCADSGRLFLSIPPGWDVFERDERSGQGLKKLAMENGRVEAGRLVFGQKGEKRTLRLVVRASNMAETGLMKAIFEGSTDRCDRQMRVISHSHIPHLTWFPEAAVKLVATDLRTRGFEVGYIPGAGDEIPAALAEMGYQVTELTEKDLGSDLSRFTAVILGIRAINTNENIGRMMPLLHDYAERGGNVIVQYNTNRGLQMPEFSPKPLQLGRDRVTEEDAPVTFLLPEDPALNTPNRLTENDFEDWVQERGLYFGSRWHEDFRAPLGWNDTGEEMKTGALLILRHGKGHFVYTGISFFRQLPAGVPGAYRLLANLISME